MADTKISELTDLTNANMAVDDEMVVVDTDAAETKKITIAELDQRWHSQAVLQFTLDQNTKNNDDSIYNILCYHGYVCSQYNIYMFSKSICNPV